MPRTPRGSPRAAAGADAGRHRSRVPGCIRLGADAEIRFLGDLAAGNLIVEPVGAGDWLRIAELVRRYRDLPLGTVDASVVAAAERLRVVEVATLDRRHFTVVRPAHVDAFTLVP